MDSFTGLKDYVLTEVEVTDVVFGQGSYADVIQLKYMGLKCAGKKIHELLLKGEDQYALRRYKEECHLLSQVRHPNIVQFLGVYRQEDRKIPILVMEYVPTNLTSCIETYTFLPKEICHSILYDIALGLNYLHSRDPPIIHRDLSSNNILLTPNMTAKISDLGVARLLNLNHQQMVMTKNPGTLVFMPPEVNMASPTYGTGVDEFSYGIIVLHLLCRVLPQPQIGQTITDSKSGKLIPVSELERREKFIQMVGSDHPLMMLIVKCLNNNPEKRAHASEMVSYLAPLVSDQLCQLDILKCIEANEKALKEDKERIDKEISRKMKELEVEFNKSEANLQRLKEAHKRKMEELQQQIDSLSEEARMLTDHEQSLSEKLQKQEECFSATIQSLEGIQESMKSIHEEKSCEREKNITSDSKQVWKSTFHEQELHDPEEIYECPPEPIPPAVSLENIRQCDSSFTVESEVAQTAGEQEEVPRKRRWANTFMDKFKWGHFAQKQQQKVAAKSQLADMKEPSEVLSTSTSITDIHQKAAESSNVRKDTLYVAKFDYEASKDDELSFRKGDVMCIASTDGDWWYATLRDSGQKGYIPNNFIVEYNSLDAEEWFFGKLEHDKAKQLLMKPANPPGSFLVCETTAGSFTLFVRESDNEIIAYPIQQKQHKYFVNASASFNTIQELIVYEELSMKLKYPCFISEHIIKSEIDRNQIKVLDKKLGSSHFGPVRQGLLKATSVTVKILSASRESSYRRFLHEVHILQVFNHPNIVRVLGVCTQERPYFIITEFLKHGNLLEYLNSSDGKSLLQPQLIKMAAQVAAGMLQLEMFSCVHRNLAAQSIQIGENLVCKLSDFHYAQTKTLGQTFPIRPSIRWTAPEVLTDQTFSTKSDIWSFGIVLYELITQGSKPYPDMTDKEVEQKVIREAYQMPCPKDCPEKLYNIMQKCWKQESILRPTFAALQKQLSVYYKV